MSHKRKYWRIVGYNSTRKIYEDTMLLGCCSEREMEALLRALVAKAALTYEEIVDSYAKRNTRRHASHLEVQRDAGARFILNCGSNPYFTASVVEEGLLSSSSGRESALAVCL